MSEGRRRGTLPAWWNGLSRRAKGWAVVLGVVAVLIIVGTIAGPKHSSTAGTMSAKACMDVVTAGREAFTGDRSMTSFLSVVRRAEKDARSAADLDSHYEPILNAIVRLQDALETDGDVGEPAGYLASQCGS